MSADLVIVDWNEVTYPYQDNNLGFVDVLVQRAKSGSVHSVMIGGNWVYRERRFTRVDREAVLAEIAERLSLPLTPAEIERQIFARNVMPYVSQFYEGYLHGSGDDLIVRSL